MNQTRYKNIFFISSFLSFLSFLIIVVSFWNSESIFWNYSPYRVQEFVTDPIYATTSLSNLNGQLQTMLNGIALGTIFFVVSLSIVSFCSFKLKMTGIRFLAIITFGTSLLALIGFWINMSLNIHVVSIGDYLDNSKPNSLVTPTIWVQKYLPTLYASYSFIGFTISVLFSIVTGFLFCLLVIKYFLNKKDIEGKKVPTSKIKIPLSQYIVFYSVMILYLIITLIPVFLTFLVSFLNPNDLTVFSNNKDLFPIPSNFISATVVNYSTVLFIIDKASGESFTRSLIISLFLGFGTSIIGLGMSLTSAYALSRYKFLGRGKLIFSLVVIQMFPGIILLIPQYIMWTSLGLLNKDVRLVGVLFALSVGAIGYSTWMMKGYFDTLPKDLEEASLIDGANIFETFMRIAIPLAKPGMVAVFLFTFLGAWNDFILVRTFIGENQGDSPLSLLFYKFQDSSRPDVPVYFGLVGAYSIIMALPVCIVFIILQKYLAAGATAGAIK